MTAIIPFIKISEQMPPYGKTVVLYTNKGKVIGYLKQTDKSGHHWEFLESNDTYWASAIPLYWTDIPDLPKELIEEMKTKKQL